MNLGNRTLALCYLLWERRSRKVTRCEGFQKVPYVVVLLLITITELSNAFNHIILSSLMHMIMCVCIYNYCGLHKIVYSGICLFIHLLASKCPQRLLCAGHRPGLLNTLVCRMNALPPCQPSSSRENKRLVKMDNPPKAA